MPFSLFKLTAFVGSIALIRVIIDYLQPKCKPRYMVKGRTIIVTGANSGIGYETAKELYKEGATVVIACRNEKKAEDAIKKIEKQCSNVSGCGQLMFIKLDLNNFESITQFANTIKQKNLNIFALINNAGVYTKDFRVNESGFEEQFMVNHLGPQLLNELLIPNLVSSGTPLSPSKIIFVSSILYKHGSLHEKFFEPFALTEPEFKKTKMYANSKLACLLYARELAEQASKSEYPMYINIASPGMVKTNLGRDIKYKWLFSILMAPTFLFILRTPKQGAQTILQCTLANNLSSNGKFFRKCRESEFEKVANNKDLMRDVYNLTRKAIGL